MYVYVGVLQVLGAVPVILEQQAAELDRQDKQQQQQEAAAEGAGSSSEAAAAAQQHGEQPPEQPEQPQQQQEQSAEEGVASSLEAKGVPTGLAAAVDAALKLDDNTLASVSRAIMGRLDVVDLVGRNTAYEVAERVRVWLGFCWPEPVWDAALQHVCWACHAARQRGSAWLSVRACCMEP